MDPIPLVAKCPTCGHPTFEFKYRERPHTTGMWWWKKTVPMTFKYHCTTCSEVLYYMEKAIPSLQPVSAAA